MTLSKADIIEDLVSLGFSRTAAAQLLETILETIKSTLENGEAVSISRFGKFSVKEKKERRGRNPATGNDLVLDARRVVTFSCSGVLRDKLNPQ